MEPPAGDRTKRHVTPAQPDPRTDQALWAAAVGGEAGAFGELFARHHLAVYNFCFRRTASWSDAEELVSVAFLEAWRGRRRMKLAGDSMLPWLYGIATRVTSRRHRSRTRHRRALARITSQVVDAADPADDIVERLADEQRMRELHPAFEALPRGERDALELAAFADLDYAEIGVALGVPVGTVRSRLSRGRARMRLAQDGTDGRDDALEEAIP